MADVSNLKMKKHSNVESPNLRITKIGNKIGKLIYIKKRIRESAKLRVVQNII